MQRERTRVRLMQQQRMLEAQVRSRTADLSELWEANSQYDAIGLRRAVLCRTAVMVPFALCANSGLLLAASLPDVRNRHDSDAAALQQSMNPDRVLAALDESREPDDRLKPAGKATEDAGGKE